MSSLKIEGDISDIGEEQLHFIKSVLADHGYKDNKVTFSRVGKKGDNFAASVKRMTIEEEDGKQRKMIVKLASQNEVLREMLCTTFTFQNEIVMYKQLFPKCSQLEKQFDIPEEERFVYPACYGAFEQIPHEVLLLEDMTECGYEIKDKMVSLDVDTVKLVLKSLAHFHALSYVLKRQSPEIFNQTQNSLGLFWELMSQKDFVFMFGPLEEQIISLLDSEVAKKKSKGLLVNIPAIQYALYKSDLNSKESVILQGDTWTNNFLFKNEEGKPTTCVMIDYQLCRVSNPASDILMTIFNCTDYDTRKEHFDDWIDHYYTELEKSLSYFEIKSQLVLSRDKLDSDIRRYGKLSVAMSAFGALMTMREETEAQNMMDEFASKAFDGFAEGMDVKHLKQESLQRIMARIRGSFAFAIESGLL